MLQLFLSVVTGGARYIPGGNSVGSSGTASNADPFTGATRYVPSSQNSVTASSNMPTTDPFTGGARYVPNASNIQTSSELVLGGNTGSETALFPQASYVRFDQANLQAIKGENFICYFN